MAYSDVAFNLFRDTVRCGKEFMISEKSDTLNTLSQSFDYVNLWFQKERKLTKDMYRYSTVCWLKARGRKSFDNYAPSWTYCLGLGVLHD